MKMDMLIIAVASAGTVLSIVFAVALVRLTDRLTALELLYDSLQRSFERLLGLQDIAKEITQEIQRRGTEEEVA